MKILENFVYGILAVFSLVVLFIVDFFNSEKDKN